MGKAAEGFLPEAYFKYVEGKNPRRTQHIGKKSISILISEGFSRLKHVLNSGPGFLLLEKINKGFPFKG